MNNKKYNIAMYLDDPNNRYTSSFMYIVPKE